MATPEADRHGLGSSAKLVAESVSSIVRLELELATAELRRKLAALGIGIGLVVLAGVFGLLAIGLGVATVVAAIALVWPVWASLLVVTGGVLLLVGLLVGIGVSLIRRGSPPVPTEAIEQARLTTEALKRNGSH
jgi:uncharacterized membrane protein YqjE